jgi:hypothetical protein
MPKAFKLIFTSPSSAEERAINSSAEFIGAIRRRRGERRTRTAVAQILNMRSVDPRAIAYTAVQVSGQPSMQAHDFMTWLASIRTL